MTDRKLLCMSPDEFLTEIKQLVLRSDQLLDGWMLVHDSYASKTVHRSYEGALITFEHHVAYNPSYSCPVLCFNAFRPDGSLVSLEECWKMAGFAERSAYGVLTQMDHPVLQRPFLTLHPCRTAELMGSSFGDSKNAVVSWLSVVGPFVGLTLMADYAKLTF